MKANRTTSSRKPSERGQSLVELAISLTVMLLLLSGAVTFGMALFSYVAMRDAAQEGALWGSFNPFYDVSGTYKSGDPVNAQAICDRVTNASKSPVDMSPSGLAFTCINTQNPPPPNNIDVRAVSTDGTGTPLSCEGPPTTGSASAVNAVQVTVTYDFPIFMPFVGGIVGSDHIRLTAQVTDTILEPKCP